MITIDLQKTLETSAETMLLDIKLKVPKGQFVILYGPSGSGKTSTLRMIAGLLNADKGSIEVEGEVWVDTASKINKPPQERKIGYVFQEYALFPNMSIYQNLQYALSKNENPKILQELITLMELTGLQDSKPKKLSGGQQQRVALARALVRKPEILLLDEPLSALDIRMRNKLQDYLLKVHKKYKMTILMVSHEYHEMVKMADQVYGLDQGKIITQGDPRKLLVHTVRENSLQLEGEIVEIYEKGKKKIVGVLIGTNLVKITVPPEEIDALYLGANIILISKNDRLRVQKIKESTHLSFE